jgi:AraC-like DNA-binding protein
MYQILVDGDLKENIRYENHSFPVDIYRDDYGLFADHTMNCHWHGELEFNQVACGSVDFYLNGVKVPLQAGESIFINSGVLHMARQKNRTEKTIVQGVTFDAGLFTRGNTGLAFLKYFEGKTEGFKWNETSAEGKVVTEALKELVGLDRETYGYELYCMSLLSKIWYYTTVRMEQESLPEQKRSHNGGVKRILSHIHEHFQERITVEDLVETANISRSEAFRCFKQYAGVSPMAYVNDYRLSRAAELLAGTGQNVTEVCFACGFTDTSYFVKLFREKYGIPPLKYRKKFSGQ